MKTGLVLEGGAMRGLYTAGVLDVLLENGLFPDGVIGVSAGALHGCSYVSRQDRRSIRYFMRCRKNWRFMSFRSLLLSGNVVNSKYCYDDLPNRIDPFDYQAFITSPMDFYAVVTNLWTGEAEYIRCTDLRLQMDVMRASASMPYVSRPVWIHGAPYLDGGVADSVPLKAFQELGYQRNLVVLTQVDGYHKKEGKYAHPSKMYRRYPNFQEALLQRPRRYNETLSYIKGEEAKGDTLVIRPSRELHIGRMERNLRKLWKIYLLGRHDAKKKLPQIREFLGATE